MNDRTCPACNKALTRARSSACAKHAALWRDFIMGRSPSTPWASPVPWDRLALALTCPVPKGRPCPDCGVWTPYTTKPRRCDACAADRYREAKRRHKRRSPGHRARMARSSALRRGAKAAGDLIRIRDLADRDEWTCHICCKPVVDVPHKRWAPHPLGPTIDHLQPVAHGGTHTWDNVRLAHFTCNSHRGATPMPHVPGGGYPLEDLAARPTPRRCGETRTPPVYGFG